MATRMETLSPSHCESGAKVAEHTFVALTDGRIASKSDSSSDEERSVAKTGSNNLLQNNLSPSQSQKRPMNAFLIFCKRHRSVVRQKYPHLENRSITKILGEWWAALDSDQKLKYTELARQYKEAFMKANPHFKWYKTTDLRPSIAPPSPPPAPIAPPTNYLAQNSTQPQAQTQQNQTQSTPKPPKKRYLENLENGEYKATHNATPNVISNASTSGQTSTSAVNTCSNAGPPILDIETANRVIENALSGSGSVSNSFNTNREQSAFNSDIINGHINSVIEQHTIETQRELEALERSSHHKTASVPSLSPNPTQSTSVDKSATNSISHPVRSPPPPPTPSDEEPEEETNDDDEDKPLNLSASTVLHTSNQHIIDHFIDKLLSTGMECSSSEPLSLPFTSSPIHSSMSSSVSHFNSSGNDNNNKMSNNCSNDNNKRNNNNKTNNISNNSINENTNNGNSLGANANPNPNPLRGQSRKDRSCKGKRYLEILNENKIGKRSRTVSQTGGHSGADKDEGSAKNYSSNQSSTGTGGHSKWVSGGFDLEEHIAQLPQLGDTHLLNALSHSKANKTINSSNKSGSNEVLVPNNHLKPQKSVNNCSVNESNNNSGSDKSNSDIEDNDMSAKSRHSNQSIDNTLKRYTTDANEGNPSAPTPTSETDTQSQTKTGTNVGVGVRVSNKVLVSDQTNEDKHKTDDLIVNTINNSSDLVNSSLPTTQGIEFSDGLAALAEVALQQPRNTV